MLGAKLISPLLAILSGPVICGVTLVFASVTRFPCNVSFVVTFKTTLETSAVETVRGPSFTASNRF